MACYCHHMLDRCYIAAFIYHACSSQPSTSPLVGTQCAAALQTGLCRLLRVAGLQFRFSTAPTPYGQLKGARLPLTIRRGRTAPHVCEGGGGDGLQVAVVAENTPLVQVARCLRLRRNIKARVTGQRARTARWERRAKHRLRPCATGHWRQLRCGCNRLYSQRRLHSLRLSWIEVPGTQLVVVVLKTPLVHVMNDEAPGGLIV